MAGSVARAQAWLIRRKRDKKDHVPGHLMWPALKCPQPPEGPNWRRSSCTEKPKEAAPQSLQAAKIAESHVPGDSSRSINTKSVIQDWR